MIDPDGKYKVKGKRIEVKGNRMRAQVRAPIIESIKA